MIQWCYSGVLQWCYGGVTVMIQWCYSGVTVVSQWCYIGVSVFFVTVVVHWFHNGVTMVVQRCVDQAGLQSSGAIWGYSGVTAVLEARYRGVTVFMMVLK
jgi:hypothetical protein